MPKNKYGFTIVELLIVIVVIAILATISVVAYNGIQNRTNDSIIQQDLANFAKKAELYKIDNDHYPTPGSLDALGFKATRSAYDLGYYNLYYCVNPSGSQYSLAGKSKSAIRYYITSEGRGNIGAGSMSWANLCNGTAPPTTLNTTHNGGNDVGTTGYNPSSLTWSTWVGQ